MFQETIFLNCKHMLCGNSVTKKVLVKHAKPDSMLLLFLSNYEILCSYEGFPGGSSAKESTCQCRRHRRCRFDPWARKIHWRRKWQPAPVFLPGKSHGERSLVTYSPWGCRVRYNLAAKYTHSHTHTHTHTRSYEVQISTHFCLGENEMLGYQYSRFFRILVYIACLLAVQSTTSVMSDSL